MSIECAFFGFLSTDAEQRTSQAGKPWARLNIGVGKDDVIQWVSVAVFGKAAEAAATLKKGDRCYVEGTIKINSWHSSDGAERHGLSVAAFKCEPTHRIGRNNPERQQKRRPAPTPQAKPSAPAFNDEIGLFGQP
jgi:single-stranded DNA-binding protein